MFGRLPAGTCGDCELMGNSEKVCAGIVLHVVMNDDFTGWIGYKVFGWWYVKFGFDVRPIGGYFWLFCGPYVVQIGWWRDIADAAVVVDVTNGVCVCVYLRRV